MESLVEPLAGLVREHRLIESIVQDTREALGRARHSNEEAIRAAVERVLDLDAYLFVDLARHIEKEEEVLFPALRGFGGDMDQAVDDMFAQHDEVRQRRANIAEALDKLDQGHERVEKEKARLRDAAKGVVSGALITDELIASLSERVRQLDAILQGHFGDEEDGVFWPSLDLLSEEGFAALSAPMAAIDARV